MPRNFLDTSALIKLYRIEPNSALVKALLLPSDDLFIAQITLMEYLSAFYGLVRQSLLSLPDAQAYIANFQLDLPQYSLVPMDAHLIAMAQTLLDIYAVNEGLRPLDALQLASALEENARTPIDLFVTTDNVLARVAAHCGLLVKP